MARSLYHDLDVFFPCLQCQLAKYLQLCKLCLVTCISKTARSQAIAKAQTYIISPAYLKYTVKVCVQRVLLIMISHPLGHDRSAAAYDPHMTLCRHRQELMQKSAMQGHEVYTLFCLNLNYIEQVIYGKLMNLIYPFKYLIDRDSPQRYRTVLYHRLTDLMDIFPCTQIHYGIRPVFYAEIKHFSLLIH